MVSEGVWHSEGVWRSTPEENCGVGGGRSTVLRYTPLPWSRRRPVVSVAKVSVAIVSMAIVSRPWSRRRPKCTMRTRRRSAAAPGGTRTCNMQHAHAYARMCRRMCACILRMPMCVHVPPPCCSVARSCPSPRPPRQTRAAAARTGRPPQPRIAHAGCSLPRRRRRSLHAARGRHARLSFRCLALRHRAALRAVPARPGAAATAPEEDAGTKLLRWLRGAAEAEGCS